MTSTSAELRFVLFSAFAASILLWGKVLITLPNVNCVEIVLELEVRTSNIEDFAWSNSKKPDKLILSAMQSFRMIWLTQFTN